MPGRTIIHRPIIVVESVGEKQIYRLHLTEIDSLMADVRPVGILLSDLIDHVAHAYADATGMDVRDVRARVVKVMRDEDRFKEKDPKRVQSRGISLKPAN